MSERQLDSFDRLLVNVDRAVRTLTRDSRPALRISPAWCFEEPELTAEERAHAASLMRVNHAGEVCAQALYQGQALTAKLPTVGAEMARAADEEVDHLAWCEERIQELGSHTSLLNPLWYGMSFVLGAAAGVVGDRYSLGFVSATEEQVCEHLKNHLQSLPVGDDKSRSILEQMLTDEEKHGHAALEAGGIRFPAPVKRAMSLVSTVMTEASYRI